MGGNDRVPLGSGRNVVIVPDPETFGLQLEYDRPDSLTVLV
jgi:hypothetical protein